MVSRANAVILSLVLLLTCSGCDLLSDFWGGVGAQMPEYDYQIIYHLNGGLNSQNNPSGFNTQRTTDIQLDDASRDGYVFEGWFSDEEFTNHIVNISRHTTEDVEVYAKWEFLYALREQGPAGGLIFYRDEQDEYSWNYLEAAPSGWNGTSTDPYAIFGYWKESPNASCMTVGTENTIGSGKMNTDKLVAAMGDSAYRYHDGTTTTDIYAAKICTDLVLQYNSNTYEDWFLPSENELLAMKQNLHNFSIGGFSSNSYDYYWSSSEEYGYPWLPQMVSCILNFSEYRSRNVTKQEIYFTRPIRAF